MRKTYEDRLRQGRELRQMRRQHAIQGSPCERCQRDFCPQLCFPLMDFNKYRQKDDEARSTGSSST